MKLNRQLLFISLLLLSLPWAGCQFLRELDSALRSGQEQSLIATTQAIAAVLAEEPELLYPQPERFRDSTSTAQPIYFHSSDYPPIVDGYDEDWEAIPAVLISPEDDQTGSIRYRATAYKDKLFLFFEISDNSIKYNNPMRSRLNDGDRLVLVTGASTASATANHYVLTTSAPGALSALYRGGKRSVIQEPSIRGNWQDTESGYNLEIEMPRTLTQGRLGYYVVNQNNADQETTVVGSVSPNENKLPPWLIYQPDPLKEKLAIFAQPGLRLKVVDRFAWQLSEQGEIDVAVPDTGNWVLRKVYRAILRNKKLRNKEATDPDYTPSVRYSERMETMHALGGTAESKWYNDPLHTNRKVLASAAPIIKGNHIVGAVLAEQSSEQFLALTDKAFNRLFLFSLVALGITGLGLIGYASWLSWRVRRLSRAAQEVMSPNGQILDNFPQSQARDEIGDLSRNYSGLLDRIREYTDYLQTLSRKLSHELRTPLAVVHSSLDNLEQQSLDDDSLVYQKRAKDGALRLGNILTAMSEATRVEESIQGAELETVNVASLLRSVVEAYQALYQQHQIVFELVTFETVTKDHPGASADEMLVVPDLLVQMLDKLVDNAVDFCPPGGEIRFSYQSQREHIVIEVSNDGPLLPDNMLTQLFDNLVSLREKSGDKPHLGLGLHIVQLIVAYHQGSISAHNREDESGVTFRIALPKIRKN